MTTRRQPRPRSAIVVAPVAISTETCLQLGGIVPRKLREALAAHPDIPRSRIGHTLIVEPMHFLALLERFRVTDAEDDRNADAPDAFNQPRSVDEVLAKLGRERTPGSEVARARRNGKR